MPEIGISTMSQLQTLTRTLRSFAAVVPCYYIPLTRFISSYPPDLTPFLNSSSLTSKIGAESPWQSSNMDVYNNFAATGDWMTNSRPDLETVIDAGVCMLILLRWFWLIDWKFRFERLSMMETQILSWIIKSVEYFRTFPLLLIFLLIDLGRRSYGTHLVPW